jgi:hypothetical protein
MNPMQRYAPSLIQLQAAEGFAYEGRATIKLQSGITYGAIVLDSNIVERATIKKVAIDINGSEVVTARGTELHMLDTLLGKHTAAGQIVIDLARHEYRSMMGIRQKELVTNVTDDVTLIVELGTKDAADPATPTIKGKAWVTDNQSPQYFMPSMYRLTQNIAAAGEHEFYWPNAAPNRWIQRLSFNEAVATVSQLEIKRGNLTIFKGTRADIDFALQRFGGYTLQAGWFIFDPTVFGFGSHGSLNTGRLNSLKFILTVDSGGAMDVIHEGYEQIRQIAPAAQ